ncbi:hypothetical protein CIRG_04093 [Coccidioides immitis RMSCC 2394]|uniref:Uncharacterized protein n=1 Tax=Coccidioides immitis RMSCC 2394 TaxID=404692 RepID=A0A0J7B3I4_COCIT|nr:hypothetical protein CIRG_04093 [Coccidioides immitis RMSCC 2394]
MDVSFPFTKPTSLKFLLVRKKMNMSPQMTFATGEFLEIQTQEVISKRVPEPNHMEPTSFWFWQQGVGWAMDSGGKFDGQDFGGRWLCGVRCTELTTLEFQEFSGTQKNMHEDHELHFHAKQAQTNNTVLIQSQRKRQPKRNDTNALPIRPAALSFV